MERKGILLLFLALISSIAVACGTDASPEESSPYASGSTFLSTSADTEATTPACETSTSAGKTSSKTEKTVLSTTGKTESQTSSGTVRTSEQQTQATTPPPPETYPAKGIPVLMYHSISTNPGNGNCSPEEQFSEEIDWLYKHNYHTLSIDEFDRALTRGDPLPDKPVLITFDDGYADNYQTAWPILKRYGFRATFFIVTNNVCENTISWDQLKELVDEGNSIGSHTVHHYDLKTLSYTAQKKELLDSKRALEEHLGIKVKAFCYPSSSYNDTTLELLQELGYTLSFTTKPGRVHYGDAPFELRRVRVYSGMPLSVFIGQVSY